MLIWFEWFRWGPVAGSCDGSDWTLVSIKHQWFLAILATVGFLRTLHHGVREVVRHGKTLASVSTIVVFAWDWVRKKNSLIWIRGLGRGGGWKARVSCPHACHACRCFFKQNTGDACSIMRWEGDNSAKDKNKVFVATRISATQKWHVVPSVLL